MKVYNIKKEEISKFTSLSNNGSDFKKTVQEMWEKELTSPEWCFVIEEKGKIIGRIGYWSSKEDKENIRIFGLLLPWEGEDILSIGKKVLKEINEEKFIEMIKKVTRETLDKEEKKIWVYDLSLEK